MSIALNLLQAALAVGVGAVFVASALPKLRHPRGFVLAVMEYRVLPVRASWIVGRLLPPLELLVGLLLVTGILLPVASGIAMVLLLCFLAAVAINLARGRELDCQCFGNARKRSIGWGVVVEDAALFLASAVLLVVSSGEARAGALPAWSPWRLLSLAGTSLASGVVAAVVLAAIVVISALVVDPRSALRQVYAARAK